MLFYIILLLGISLDLYTKSLASIYLQKQVNIFGDFFYFKYVENTGIAFSIAIPFLILKSITIILIILIFYYYINELKLEKKKNNIFLLKISFGLILSGAIGNGIERIFNEKVIDFIGVKNFSIFNLADSFIFIGAILYLFVYYKNNKLGVFDLKK